MLNKDFFLLQNKDISKLNFLVVKLVFFLFMETIVKWTVFAYDRYSRIQEL